MPDWPNTRAMSTMPRRSRSLGDRAVARMASIASSNSAGGPDVETAVRTTGLLTAGRNPGTERTRLPAVDEQGEQRYFRGTTTSRPLDCGLSPLHHGSIHSLNSAPHQTTSARSAKSSSPACKRLVAGHWPRGGGGGPSPAATSFSSPFRPAQTTSSCFEWTPTLS